MISPCPLDSAAAFPTVKRDCFPTTRLPGLHWVGHLRHSSEFQSQNTSNSAWVTQFHQSISQFQTLTPEIKQSLKEKYKSFKNKDSSSVKTVNRITRNKVLKAKQNFKNKLKKELSNMNIKQKVKATLSQSPPDPPHPWLPLPRSAEGSPEIPAGSQVCGDVGPKGRAEAEGSHESSVNFCDCAFL